MLKEQRHFFSGGLKWTTVFAAVAMLLVCLGLTELSVFAAEQNGKEYHTGIASFINPTVEDLNNDLARIEEEQSDLVMANVNDTLNVRREPSETAEKAGFLYKDCGGTILERRDGWTKLQSGDLVGWARDDYLLFNREAEALANEVGNLIAKVETESLRVRKEPNVEADIHGMLDLNDEVTVIEELNEEWVSIEYEGEEGFVSAEYVTVSFKIDSGETIEVVRERERQIAEEKARLNALQGAVMAAEDEVRLLAALIQCEAGNQPIEGQLAVGAVVMNRVRSPGYPNSIHSVIFASGQFPPALNGKVARVYAGTVKDSCIEAATRAINGETNVGTATRFRRAGNHEGIVIGDHVFW